LPKDNQLKINDIFKTIKKYIEIESEKVED
jgi:septum formation topological specificity factor MinE